MIPGAVCYMKLSLNWPKEFLSGEKPVAETVEALTFAGVEVEGVQRRGADFDQVIVAQVGSFEPHPNADRLSVEWTRKRYCRLPPAQLI